MKKPITTMTSARVPKALAVAIAVIVVTGCATQVKWKAKGPTEPWPGCIELRERTKNPEAC
jgi:hypothetical protein